MINNAKKSIKIMTPYIALDNELLTSLVIAARSGVEVSIIIPGIPDKKSVYTVTKSFIEDLLEVGIKVYKYKPGFCHAKILMIDDIDISNFMPNNVVGIMIEKYDFNRKVALSCGCYPQF